MSCSKKKKKKPHTHTPYTALTKEIENHGQRMTSFLINVLEFAGQGLNSAAVKTQRPPRAGSEPLSGGGILGWTPEVLAWLWEEGLWVL